MRPGAAVTGERSRERGAIAVLMALMLTVIMGFAALGVDVAYIRLARMEMKTAADAAAHAGMTVLRMTKGNAGTAAAKAKLVAGKNFVLGVPVTLEDEDIVFGIWDYDTNTFAPGSTPINALRINGRKSDPSASAGTIKATLGRTLGITEANIAQTSFGAYRPRAMMFEMDITGSFLQNPSCAIDHAIAADLAFLEAMYNAASTKDRIGLDVFTGKAYPYTPLQLIQPNYDAIKSDWEGDELSATLASHEYGLGVCTQDPVDIPADWSYEKRTDADWTCGHDNGKWPNQAYLKPGIKMPACWAWDDHYVPPTTLKQVYGGTNIGSAIQLGKKTLLDVGKTYEARSIVVFTDGGPLCCENPRGGDICPQATECCADATAGTCDDHMSGACKCSEALVQYAIDQANDAAANGIDVYVLAFGNKANWINFARSLARGRGFTLDTNDKNQLKTKLEEIANAIPVALVQ
jgi:Flp pilus assembly protein TadG